MGSSVKRLTRLRNRGTPGSTKTEVRSFTPRGVDMRRRGAISFEIPSKDVIHAQTVSGLDANSLANERVVITITNVPLQQWRVSGCSAPGL